MVNKSNSNVQFFIKLYIKADYQNSYLIENFLIDSFKIKQFDLQHLKIRLHENS
jgi:hypothetical protein